MSTKTHLVFLVVYVLFRASPAKANGISNGFNSLLLGDAIRKTSQEALGFDQLQALYDRYAKYSAKAANWNAVLVEKVEAISVAFSTFNNAVRALRDQLERGTSHTKSGVKGCCNVTKLYFDTDFKRRINLTDICTRTDPDVQDELNLPGEGFLTVARQNYRNHKQLKWQYVGTEEGGTTIYPAYHGSCDFKPRTRPWYVETSAPEPKDIVIVMDHVANGILKNAAITVLNSSNPNDRIGIVVFGGKVLTPGHPSRSTCYRTQLALGTPQNIQYFREYLLSVTGKSENEASKYLDAIDVGFRFFSQANDTLRNRTKVMLFFSASNPTEAVPHAIPEEIRKKNKGPKQVVILTFSTGDITEQTKQILQEMAAQTMFENGRTGRHQHLETDSNLRFQLSSYFDAVSDPLNDPLHVLPYIDNWGLGLIISICMPFFKPLHVLRGVVCVDGILTDLLPGVQLEPAGQGSYFFLIDKLGRTIMHPLLAPPNERREDNLYIDISLLEQDQEAQAVIDSMKRGQSGSKKFLATRPILKKVAPKQWVTTHQVTFYYYWQQIPHTNYSLCLVSIQNDFTVAVTLTPEVKNIDEDTQLNCLDAQGSTSSDFSEAILGAPARACPPSQQMETTLGRICPGVKEEEELTEHVYSVWKSKDSQKYNHAIYQRYIATANGVLRTFPAANVNYNITDLPWYGKAITHSAWSVISRQNQPGGSTTTLARVIRQGRSGGLHADGDFKVAVVAAVFHPGFFFALLRRTLPACNNEGFSCFLVDESGGMILHPRLASSNNSHILSLEPKIADTLESRGYLFNADCTNIETVLIQRYWQISLPGGIIDNMANQPAFKLQVVPGTNLFVGIKEEDDHPPQPKESSAAETLEFNYCNYTLTKRDSQRLTCPLAVDPSVKHVNNFHYSCSQSMCLNNNEERSCTSLEGCLWCHTRDGAKCGLFEYCGTAAPDNTVTIIIAVTVAVVFIVLLGPLIYCIRRCRRRRQPRAREPDITRQTRRAGHDNLGQTPEPVTRYADPNTESSQGPGGSKFYHSIRAPEFPPGSSGFDSSPPATTPSSSNPFLPTVYLPPSPGVSSIPDLSLSIPNTSDPQSSTLRSQTAPSPRTPTERNTPLPIVPPSSHPPGPQRDASCLPGVHQGAYDNNKTPVLRTRNADDDADYLHMVSLHSRK